MRNMKDFTVTNITFSQRSDTFFVSLKNIHTMAYIRIRVSFDEIRHYKIGEKVTP